jgi:hypothetical protein
MGHLRRIKIVVSKLRIKICSKWQEYFPQSAQSSQRKSKALAFISKQKPRLLFLAFFASSPRGACFWLREMPLDFAFSSGLSGLVQVENEIAASLRSSQ